MLTADLNNYLQQQIANLGQLNKPLAEYKVIVGMSGGVDSTVAAYLLQKLGLQVEGLFMKNWEEDDGTDYCTAIADLEDAQAVCHKLNIPLHTANFAAEYWDNVFSAFLAELKNNRTPNPDILCNREIKFYQFADYANLLGADFIATGHYAQTLLTNNDVNIYQGIDDNKDQTYFLQAVPKGKFKNVIFPLGGLNKTQVRNIAQAQGFHNHKRKDSTGICFIGERRFSDFLNQYLEKRPGPMVDESGRHIGEHQGLHNYTRGQRSGLNIGGISGRQERPWYVLDKHPQSNCLVVTQKENLLACSWLRIHNTNWLAPAPLGENVLVKIRHRQKDQEAILTAAPNGEFLIKFAQPQRAITCGQYAAVYTQACSGSFTNEAETQQQKIEAKQLIGGGQICATSTYVAKIVSS